MEDFFLKASYYCSLSEHCIQKVREKLVQWGTPKEFIDPIIDKLLEDDYINEERFARAFVKDKFRFNHWGRVKITTHLKEMNFIIVPLCIVLTILFYKKSKSNFIISSYI